MMSVSVFTYPYGEKRVFVSAFMYVVRLWMSLFLSARTISFAVSRAVVFSIKTLPVVSGPAVQAFHVVAVSEHVSASVVVD